MNARKQNKKRSGTKKSRKVSTAKGNRLTLNSGTAQPDESNSGSNSPPKHRADLQKSGLSASTIKLMGVYSLKPDGIVKVLGWTPQGVESALAFPYPGTDGFTRLKVFPSYKDDQGHTVKYLQPKGSAAHLYILPSVHAALKDHSVPLALTEGEKKAAALVQTGAAAVGIGGIWCWLDAETRKPIPEIDQITWVDRAVTLYFDSDIWHRLDLRQPVYALGKELEDRGAKVAVAIIDQKGSEKVGIDDLLATKGPKNLAGLKTILLSHKAFGEAARWWKGWKERKGKEQIVEGEAEAGEGNGAPDLRARIDGIRSNPKIWWFHKNQWIAETTTRYLRRVGAFYITHPPEQRTYFFDGTTRKLLELKQDPFVRHLADLTGLNPTEPEFKYLVEHLLTETYRRGTQAQVYHLAHYDHRKRRVYVTDFGSGVWVLDGRSIQPAVNGVDGVLFATYDFLARPYTYLSKGERPAKATLQDFLEPISFDPTAALSPDEARELLRIWVLSLFFPELHPTKLVPTFLGPNGSTKTSTARRMGMQIVGEGFNVGHLESGQRGEQAFIATVCGKPFAAYDNADSDIRWLPDRLATFATGQVFELRELYTTNTLKSYRPTAYLVLTSRDPQFRRPDVAERLLICRTGRPHNFVAESLFFAQTQEGRDGVWSDVLDKVNETILALQKVPSAPALNFRMADFASFGWRLSFAQGEVEAAKKFQSALERLEKEQAQYATEEDPVAACLEIWLATEVNVGRGVETAELYKELGEIAKQQGLLLPKTSATLGKTLRLSKRALETTLGVKIGVVQTTHTSRWVFSKPSIHTQDSSASTLPPQPAQPVESVGTAESRSVGHSQSGLEPVFSKIIVQSDDDLAQMLQVLESSPDLVVDIETTGLDPLTDSLVGMGLCADGTKGHYIPLGHQTGEPQLLEPLVLKQLKSLLEQKRVLGHNLKFDAKFLKVRGIKLNVAFDTMLADYLLDEQTDHKLKQVAQRRLGTADWGIDVKQIATIPVEKAASYCIEDAVRTWQLYEQFRVQIDESFRFLYHEIERPLVPVLVDLELEGYPVDIGYQESLAKQYQQRLQEVEKTICTLAGRQFNLNSAKQVAAALANSLGHPVESTRQEVLERLRGKHKIVEALLRYRETAKRLSTYLSLQAHPRTGRVHPEYHQARVVTGRLASSIHTVPNEDEIRRVYVAEPGYVLVTADYKAQEVRLVAACAGEERLLQWFRQGLDPHSMLAIQLFNLKCPVEEVEKAYPEYRKQAKTIQLAMIYRSGSSGISQKLGVSVEEAKQLIERYFSLFPKIKQYQKDMVTFVKANGYVEDLVGRRRRLPEVKGASQPSDPEARRRFWHLENEAINFPIQSLGAAIIKRAMIRCHRFFQQHYPEIRLIASRHDELQFLVPESKVSRAVPRIKRLMETDFGLRRRGLVVSMAVEIKVGKTWGDVVKWNG